MEKDILIELDYKKLVEREVESQAAGCPPYQVSHAAGRHLHNLHLCLILYCNPAVGARFRKLVMSSDSDWRLLHGGMCRRILMAYK